MLSLFSLSARAAVKPQCAAPERLGAVPMSSVQICLPDASNRCAAGRKPARVPLAGRRGDYYSTCGAPSYHCPAPERA